MNIRPYGKRVLVKLQDIQENKSDSGIFLPKEMNNDMIRWGTVVAINDYNKVEMIMEPECDLPSLILDKEVCFGKHNGVELKPGYVVIKEEEILAWR